METKDTKLQNGKKRKNIYIYDLMPYQQQWLHSQQNQLFKKKKRKKMITISFQYIVYNNLTVLS